MQIQTMLNHDNVVVTSLAVPLLCDQFRRFLGHVPPMVRAKHDPTATGQMHMCFKPAHCRTEEDEVVQDANGLQILWNPHKDSALAGTVVDADATANKLVFLYP